MMNRQAHKEKQILKSSLKRSDREEQAGNQLIVIMTLFNYQFLSLNVIIHLIYLIKT